MMRFQIFAFLIVIAGAAALVPAQSASLAEQREALKQQEEQLNDKLRSRWRELSDDATMKPFQQKIRQARNAWRKTEAEDPQIIEAREAARAARDKLEAAVWEQTRQSEQGTKIRDQIAELNETLDDVEAKRRRNDFERREIEREIDDTPELRELATAKWKADRALRDARENNELYQAAEDRYRAARKTLDEKIKTLPEYAAVEEAKKAMEAARDSEQIRAARAARELADKAYEDKRKQLRDNDPAMRELRQQRDELEKSYRELREQRDDLGDQMRKLAREIQREGESVAPLREAYEAADDRYDKIKDEVTAADRTAYDQARRAYDKRMRERYRDDDVASDYRDRLDDVRRRKRIIDLKKEIRELESKVETEADPAGGAGDASDDVSF